MRCQGAITVNEWLMVHLYFKIKSGGVYPVTPAIDTKSTLPLKGGLGLGCAFLKGLNCNTRHSSLIRVALFLGGKQSLFCNLRQPLFSGKLAMPKQTILIALFAALRRRCMQGYRAKLQPCNPTVQPLMLYIHVYLTLDLPEENVKNLI